MKIQLSEILHPVANAANIKLVMARADQLYSLASGNKFYKLKYNIILAKQEKKIGLLSFGGAFSNHIHALALTAQQEGLKSIGIIRGEAHYSCNPTLSIAKNAGMQLEFVNRHNYRNKDDPTYLDTLQKRYPDYLIIPEGGSNQLAIKGCMELADDINRGSIDNISDTFLVASGTGSTLAGLVCGVKKTQNVIGHAVLKDDSLGLRVDEFIKNTAAIKNSNYCIEPADFGGYAKLDKHLLNFIFDWYQHTHILLDPIYTSKLCMRLMQQIEAGYFEKGSRLCIVHTGGLQGWLGMEKTVLKLAGEQDWNKIKQYLDEATGF